MPVRVKCWPKALSFCSCSVHTMPTQHRLVLHGHLSPLACVCTSVGVCVVQQVAPEYDSATSVTVGLPVPCCGHPLTDYIEQLRQVAVAAAEKFRQSHPAGALPTVVIEVHSNTLFTLDTRECVHRASRGFVVGWMAPTDTGSQAHFQVQSLRKWLTAGCGFLLFRVLHAHEGIRWWPCSRP